MAALATRRSSSGSPVFSVFSWLRVDVLIADRVRYVPRQPRSSTRSRRNVINVPSQKFAERT
jgi:hypothetical protein